MIIDGKKIAQKIKDNLKNEVKKLRIKPGLAVVMVGDNPASKIYINSKEKACNEIGFYSEKIILPENTSQKKLNNIIDDLNLNTKIHGILVQFPLPKRLSEDEVIENISPKKDVDCFSPVNIGKLFSAKKITDSMFVPCTPKGIMTLIESTGVNIESKNVVVLGRSNLVGKPLSMLLLNKNATVTICHSRSINLKEITTKADILIGAIGIPKFIIADMIKKGAIVIDVGINRTENGLVGDVDFENVSKIAGWITPVPGGVGPMTIASLLENTLIAYKN
jgi:methylenetetrahydrofolate dehydrogenase (NADP+) / methenyltetrahydrofolate cyclohydrolase